MKNDKKCKNIHSNIKIYRIRARLSQKKLANMSKCTATTISNLERNLKSPTLRLLVNIGKALKVCPYKLYDIEDLEFCTCKDCDKFNNYKNQ